MPRLAGRDRRLPAVFAVAFAVGTALWQTSAGRTLPPPIIMELILASLCDFAADYQGKLCVLGAFDTIWSKQYPAVHPQCSVAVRLLLREEDRGPHKLQVFFIDPDGRHLIPIEQGPNIDFDVPPLPPESFFLSRNFVLHFQGLPLPQPGQYEIRIRIDGRTLSTLPLQFVQTPEPA